MSLYAPKKPKRINSVSVSVTLILLLLGYIGWWYIPHWFRVWQMSGVMISVGRLGYREYDDQKLIQLLIQGAQRNGLRVTADNFSIWREPYGADEIEADATPAKRDLYAKRGKNIWVSFAYTTEAEWPLIGKTTTLNFERERSVELSQVNW